MNALTETKTKARKKAKTKSLVFSMSGPFIDDLTIWVFTFLKAIQFPVFAYILFILTLVDSCLISNHITSPYLYMELVR